MAAEPWLSGTLRDLPPPLASVLYSLEQVKEDVAKWTEGLTTEQIWAQPHGLAPVGFHLRHIAGSIDRLYTYAEGNQLSDQQMAELRGEMTPGQPVEELVAALRQTLDRVGAKIRTLDPATLGEARGVGRKQLPTTVIGLLIHLAEHAQRHVGAAIITAKLLRAAG